MIHLFHKHDGNIFGRGVLFINEERSKEDLIEELNTLTQRNAELESIITEYHLLNPGGRHIHDLIKFKDMETAAAESERDLDEQGRSLRTMGVVNSVTEQAKAEQNRQKLQEQLYEILENITDAFYAVDSNWRLTYINHRAEQWWDRKKEDLIGTVLWDMFPNPELTKSYQEHHRAMRERRPVYFEALSPNLLTWVETNVYPTADGGVIVYFRDVTARKQAEQTSIENEYRLEGLVWEGSKALEKANLYIASILASIKDPFLTLDQEWRFTYVNRAAHEQLQAHNNLVGENIWRLFPKMVNGIFWEKYHEVMNCKKPLCFEAESTYWGLWWEVTVYPFNQGISVLFRDITTRKQSEQALKAVTDRLNDELDAFIRLHAIITRFVRQEDLRNIYTETLDAALAITHADKGNIQLWDKDARGLKILAQQGFKESFLRHFACITEERGSCGQAYRNLRRIIVEDIATSPIFIGTPDLKILLREGIKAVQATPLISSSGKVVGILSTHYTAPHTFMDNELGMLDLLAQSVADSIERFRAEEELFKAKEQTEVDKNHLEIILDTIPSAVVLVEPEAGKIVYLNRRALELYGVNHMGTDFLDHVTKVSALKMDGTPYPLKDMPVSLSLKLGEEVRNVEMIIIKADGFQIPVLMSSAPLYDAQGNINAAIVTFDDISERKQAEANLARLDRLNLVGEMAASIGHEIRNPMTSVRGFLQMLGSKQEYESDQAYFELMIEELDRANEIITEFLGMAKNKKVDLQPLSLDSMITALYPMIQSDANKRDMTVELDLKHPPEPRIDGNEIRQLILNIVRNGLEAMLPHGKITIGTILESNKIVLFIRDEGPGLSADMLDRLGTPFLTTKDTGTGLGLPICYSIAARHKAMLDCETGPNGTTFYVRFPIPVD